jgi:cell division transport system permease protein
MNNKTTKRKPKYYTSIISVSLVLFLLGLFGFIALNINTLDRYFKENIEVSIELKNDIEDSEITTFRETLSEKDYFKKGSIEFVTKEEGAEIMKKDFGDDFTKYGLENPLLDIIHFNIKAKHLTADNLATIKKELSKDEIVENVFYEEVQVAKVTSNVYKLGGITLIIGICFALIAFVLINNTVRLALYGNRFNIKNMQLVGATETFIAKPYTQKGMINGAISGLIAGLGLAAIAYWIYGNFPELILFQDTTSLVVLFVSIILLGVLVSYITTRWSIRKFLSMSVEELY